MRLTKWLTSFLIIVACARATAADVAPAVATAKAAVTPIDVTLINAEVTEIKNGETGYPGTKWKARKIKVRVVDFADNKNYHVVITSVSGCDIPGFTCPAPGIDGYVTSDVYTSSFQESSNLVTGVLAVPFKYHFGDHATTAGSTIGGYVGYGKTETFGSLSWILGGGLALVDATPASTGTTSTSSNGTLTGVTVATGLIGAVGSTNVQFGVLIGWDFVDKSQNYKYEHKPWLSFTVGYAFSN